MEIMNTNLLIKPYYQEFLKSNPIFGEYYGAKQNWIKNDSNYHRLTITVDIETIRHFFNNNGIIPLRKYKNEKTLILGCGNAPIFICECHNTYQTHNKEDFHDSYCYDHVMNYRSQHAHSSACTVNPSLGYNPTLIAHYGFQKLSFFDDQIFDSIIFEGFLLDHNNYTINNGKYVVSELIRLLSNNGKVYIDHSGKKDLEPVFVKKENTLMGLDSGCQLSENDIKLFLDIMI